MSFPWVMYGHSWSNRAYPTSSLVNKELCCHSWCVCVKTKEAWDQKFKTWTYSLRTNLLLFQALVTSCFSYPHAVLPHDFACAGGCLRLQRLGTCGFSGCSRGSHHRCGWWHPGYLMLLITIEPQKHPQLFDAVECEKSSTQWVWPTLIPWTVHL